ncbi:hypothetical protein V5279_22575 [Bradyrhizobium sp. 26S5]|uniref:hypothetical protein n=1 Tax=Bradyrhizobium sp. 26S5 TaxID=3139729 RepID=UPI0030D0A85A
MKEKIAIPLDGTPSVVVLDNGERMTRRKAITAGYRIVDASAIKSAEAANVLTDAIHRWRLAIECLPEAAERAAATAELLASRNPETLTVGQARAFLRGLPVETNHTEQTEETLTANDDPRAVRRAEIARSMNAFNKNNGHAGKDLRVDIKDIDPARLRRVAEIRLNAMEMNGRSMTAEFKKLKLALDTHSAMGGDFSRALAQAGVDAQSLAPRAV